MKASEFVAHRERLGKSQSQLAQLLNIPVELIEDYESGETQIAKDHQGRLYFLLAEHISRIRYLDSEPHDSEIRKRVPEPDVINDPLDAGVNAYENIIGEAPEMQVVFRLIEDVARLNTTVMIEGESGTGKELVARAIHNRSPRKDKPFIVINCSAFPETLLESELFGYEKGAFTGASKTRAGRFEQADGGTLFLDEIGDISPQAQLKLLRILQTQKLKRLGGDEIISVNIRVITATNKNLKEEVLAKKFRSDLYYRLHVIPVYLPALRNKRQDIPLLANHFLESFNSAFNKRISGFSQAAMSRLMSYNWPGNTRELQHCIEYAVALAKGDLIEEENLPFNAGRLMNEDELEGDERLISVEKRHITHVLETSLWNKKEAAKRLGISRSSLYEKIKRLEIPQG